MSKELKILINNEEVVCDKQISIKEEMLSTSSTILKNCYPKSWENTKDYTNNFYFPKDYSKCKIFNETYYPENPGLIVSGSDLSIDYDNTLNYDINELKGNTTQQTYTGKNLLKTKYPYNSISNGVTISVSEDLTITIQGTATANQDFNIIQFLKPLIANKQYSLNLIYVSGSFNGQLGIFNEDGNHSWQGWDLVIQSSQGMHNYNMVHTFNYAWNSSVSIVRAYKNTVYNNFKFKLQFVADVSSDYIFEPYVGGKASPNPDYPQPINNVTGLQTIDVVGKNLFDGELELGFFNPSTGVKENNSSLYRNVNIIKVNPNTTYIMSINGIFQRYVILTYDINKNFIGQLAVDSGSFTTNNNVYYINFRCYAADFTSDYANLKVQLETGSTASSFEEYKGQKYEINLGKNLFDKDNANLIDGQITSSLTFDTSAGKTLYIECKPNTTYAVVKKWSNRTRIGSSKQLLTSSNALTQYSTNATDIGNGLAKFIITTGNQDKYLYLTYAAGNETDLSTLLDYIQIEVGSYTGYSSYFTPIELNKIGNYQDRIYKQNNKWYIEKKIKKIILNGSESDWYLAQTNTNTLRIGNSSLLSNGLATSDNKIMCDMFTPSSTSDNGDYEHIRSANDQYPEYLFILINKSRLSANTVNAFKTWLGNNNVEVDYILATPEITEITNEELISQLDSIELLDGINNISVISSNLSGILNIHYNYKEAYTVEDIIFCGCVKNTGNISLNPREPHFVDLQLLDFKCLLSEGETLNYVIANKTITEAISQVINSISDYGFVLGNINLSNSDEIIGAYSTLNKTAYDVFQYFADITQSKWTTRMIDENTIAIDFYDPLLTEKATTIENTKAYAENNKIIDISFNYSTNDYRNKQIMTSDEVFANITQTETILADGYAKTFNCQNKIGIITEIKTNGVTSSFITKNEQELGLSADYIYTPGKETLESSNVLSSGTIISITYYPIVKGREIVLNTIESSRISDQINRKGTISRYENRNDTTSSQELIKIGQSYIKYKGQAEITLKVISEIDLFNVGQIVEYQAPLEELTTDYLVKSKTIDMYITANKIFYTYELSSNFNSENAINYFDNQRAKNQGNIGEGETIVRNIDIENTALIQFYDTSIEEVEVGNYTSLDFSLDGVII